MFVTFFIDEFNGSRSCFALVCQTIVVGFDKSAAKSFSRSIFVRGIINPNMVTMTTVNLGWILSTITSNIQIAVEQIHIAIEINTIVSYSDIYIFNVYRVSQKSASIR